MSDKLKSAVAVTVRALLNIAEFAWLPVYSKRHNLHLFRQSALKLAVSVPQDGLTSHQGETEATLRNITGMLQDAEIEYFIVRARKRRISIGVMADNRAEVLQLIHESRAFAGYYCFVHKEKYNLWMHRLLSRGFSKKQRNSILAVTLYRNTGGKGERVLRGEAAAITVEFWLKPDQLSDVMKQRVMGESGISDEEALSNCIIAPIVNGVARVVPELEQKPTNIDFGDKQYPTIRLFNKKFINEVSFPIDIVYTWVNNNDPKWLKRYEKARQKLDSNFKNNSSTRYENNDELRYSLRSIEMFAPWVRNIYIVTDNQTPEWLDKSSSRIKIVDHRDIFADTSALPVFNSHAIESQLHHIDGLSEHYLYFNDDVFIANPTLPETFFFPSGVVKVQPSDAIIGAGKPSAYETAPSSAGKNARKIIEDKFGVFITNKFRHTAIPLLKSFSYQVEKENRGIVEKTMRSKFRSPDDIPFTTIMMQSYFLATGKGVPSTFPAVTIGNLSEREAAKQMKVLTQSDRIITFCLNEVNGDGEDPEEAVERMHDFLRAYYPYPASWEKHDG